VMVLFFGLVLPLIICGYQYFAGQDKRELAAPDEVDQSIAPAPLGALNPDGRLARGDDVANVTKVAKEANQTGREEGVKIGEQLGIEREREAISKRPRPIARTESELQLNPIGPGQWSIPFRMPGISRIDFGSKLDFPLGKTYYLSTMGPIPNLQVGWIDDYGDGKFATPPTSEFSPRDPLRYWMGTETALNARVVFLTERVPPGDYEIIVVESALALGPREQAPGVPSRRFYVAQ